MFKSNFFANKKVQIACAIVLSFVILLIAFGGKDGSSENEDDKKPFDNTVEYESYEENIENRIETIVNSVGGITEAKAFVYTKSSIEIVYGEDYEHKISNSENGNTSEAHTIAFSKDGTKTTAVIIKKEYPDIEGVLVVAKGADDEKKRIMIINALATVLGINITSIEVLAG